jgi:hypothetical protein
VVVVGAAHARVAAVVVGASVLAGAAESATVVGAAVGAEEEAELLHPAASSANAMNGAAERIRRESTR